MAGRLPVVIALSTTIGALLAPSANAAENWQGVWDTTNKFGHPRLKLVQDDRDVHGKYFDDNGNLKGKIKGTLSDHKDDWTGTYADNDGGDHGKFHVELRGDKVSFEGWFKSCGFTCSRKYNWTGEHA